MPTQLVSSGRAPALLRRPLALLFLCSATIGGGGCAYAKPYNPEHLGVAQLTEVGQLCQSIMRLPTGDAHYGACIDTLSQSAASINQAHAMGQAHRTCADKGLKAGSPDMAVCVLQAVNETPSIEPDGEAVAAVSKAALVNGQAKPKLFFNVSFREMQNRQRQACAMLGLDPAFAAFESCVSNMRQAFWEIDNPSDWYEH